MQSDVDENDGNNGINGHTVASTLATIPLRENPGRNTFVIPTPATTPPPMATVETRLHRITFECTVRCYSSQKLARVTMNLLLRGWEMLLLSAMALTLSSRIMV
ncbi:hypothetical protein BC829DRAFT_414683 [Chytridium lagenaria]|nr:hypothetical protein BC829DRAFT_414683 [Chytridium lagenaria]